MLNYKKFHFIIHIPGYEKGEVIEEVSGQMDLRPTLLHLMGIETKGDMQLGADIFSPDHEPVCCIPRWTIYHR